VKQKLTKNEVGGKALRLAEVASVLTPNIHFKVPTGGCLPTSVYDHYFSRISNSDNLANKVYATKDSKEQKELLSTLQNCILKLVRCFFDHLISSIANFFI
jgi:phosphoenolpyruvate synthase/pyruvate phosphate dikinase